MNAMQLDSPLGKITLVAEGDRLIGICLEEKSPVLERAAAQLAEYFAGERDAFDLPLGAEGTSFQREVWGALQKIPFGETRSYEDIARQIGRPKAVRAVGAANGKNPLAVVVPCHRVIGKSGELTGYAGGLSRKRWLLKHENAR
jgi:methylated-DNA-[protein]-cysteine S-methyltransferase